MANELNFVVKNGLTVNQDKLYVDHTTGRVGIGTNILGDNKLSVIDTWNEGATTFTGIKFDVTDTASASGSLLLDLQVDSSSQFSVDKSGNIVVGGTLNTHTIPAGTGTLALTSDIGDATITLAAGTDLATGGSFTTNQFGDSTVTFDHADITRTDTTSSETPAYGATFDVVDSVTSSATGHITAINVKTVTIPASDNTDTLQDIATDATDANQYITFVPNTTGAQTGRVDAGLTYNPSSNFLNVAGNLTVGGDLTINGTTTTVNSTTVTVDDPIFTLGGDTAPASDDNKDRGIEYRWHDGTSAKVGFFGYDDSTGKWTFIPDATNTSEVFSGTTGELDAKVDWTNLLNVPSTAESDTTGINIVGASDSATTDAAATNGNVWLNHIEAGAVVSNHNIIGTGGVTVTSDANGDITINAAVDTDTTYSISAETDAGGANLRLSDSGAGTDDVLFASGTYVTVTRTDADTITIDHNDTTRSDTSNSASPAAGGTFDIVDSVTTNATGHVEAINVKTITLPSEPSDFGTITVSDTDSGYTWAETGSAVADTTSDTVTLVSGQNINIDVDATNDAIRIQTTTDQHVLDNHTIVSATQTTTAVTEVALDSFSATTFAGAEVVVTAIQGSSRHIIKMLISHDDADTYETQFGEIVTGSSLFTLTSDINGGNVRILCTPASTTSTKFNTYVNRIEN